jgi:hypothetical protein
VSDREQVVVIRSPFTATDALCVVATLTGDLDATVAAEVIYPYYCFSADCSVPTLVGRKHLSMLCLVDAINGLGATADSFELKKENVTAENLLQPGIDDEAASGIARNTLTHRLGRKLRMISSFDVAMNARGLVHKRFFIVQTSDARVMVDSTTGSLHPLKLRAA